MGAPGEVYVLHNCGLREGLIKIGMTAESADARAKALATTGVPDDFIVLFSWPVRDAQQVEASLHQRFAEFRYRRNREFFHVSPRRAIEALLEEAGAIPRPAAVDHAPTEVLPVIREVYGPLLDPDVTSIGLEFDRSGWITVICTVIRNDDEIALRRDLFVLDAGHPVVDDPSPDNLQDAVERFMKMSPRDLSDGIPMFSERSMRLIEDLDSSWEGLPGDLRMILQESITGDPCTLDDVERSIRTKRDLPLRHRKIVRVSETGSRFLLSLDGSEYPIGELHVEAIDEDDTVAVVTQPIVTDLDPFDAVEVAYRIRQFHSNSSPPILKVTGATATGIPFEQIFSFLP